MDFCVSDIHGQGELFEFGLNKIGFDKDHDHLYIIGDAIDRGKDGIALLTKFMENPDTYTLIIGNHELMMLNSIDPFDRLSLTGYCSALWTDYNGGDVTYNRFRRLTDLKRMEILEFLKSCPVSKTVITKDSKGVDHPYILTHTAYDAKMNDMSYDEAVKAFGLDAVESHVWRSVYRKGDTRGEDNYFEKVNGEPVLFITGHIPVQTARLSMHHGKKYGDFSPLFIENRMMDIDGGAAWGKQKGVKNGLIFYNMTKPKPLPVSFLEMGKKA